jgi:hypothetical protein
MKDYSYFLNLLESDSFEKILNSENGLKFFKVYSISRQPIIKEFLKSQKMTFSRPLVENCNVVFSKIDEKTIDSFLQSQYNLKMKNFDKNQILSELFCLQSFNWGGIYQNALEKMIIDNYVKKIQSYEILNQKIQGELSEKMGDYVRSSWYNHWSTILIENIFKKNSNVIPSIGDKGKLDFFWKNIPFDLKVTYFPAGLMHEIRREKKLPSELSFLKTSTKNNDIVFDTDKTDRELFTELITKFRESINHKSVYEELIKERSKIMRDIQEKPIVLAKWLYENQGERRYDAGYRFFVILMDDMIEESWKLKRNMELLTKNINDCLNKDPVILDIKFKWKNKEINTKCVILFITKS